MEMFIGEVNGSNVHSDIQYYNNEFLSKIVDPDIVTMMNQILTTYIYDILLRIETIEELKKNLDLVTKEDEKNGEILKEETEKLKELSERKSELNKSRLEIVNSSVDVYKLQEIDRMEKEIDNLISARYSNLGQIQVKKNGSKELLSRLSDRLDYEEERIKYGIEYIKEKIKEIESFVSTYGEKPNISTSLLEGIDIDSMKEDYEKGLEAYITDPSIRKVYADFFFSTLRKESKLLITAFETSKKYVENVSAENGYVVSELEDDNNKIRMGETLLYKVYEQIGRWIGVSGFYSKIEDKELLSKIADSYSEVGEYVDQIYDFIEDFAEMQKDDYKFNLEYKEISDKYQQMVDKMMKIKVGFVAQLMHIIQKGRRANPMFTLEGTPLVFGIDCFQNLNSDIFKMHTSKKVESKEPERTEEATTNMNSNAVLDISDDLLFEEVSQSPTSNSIKRI